MVNVVRQIRDAAGLTQSELAELGRTSQPAIAAYESGAKLPSLRTLRRLAAAAGLNIEMTVTPALTREDRRSLAVHRRIAKRLQQDPEPVIEKAKANIDKMRRLHPGAAELLDDWEATLDRPIGEIVEVMTNTRPRMREMRQVTPFAGILDPAERADVIRQFRVEEGAR